MRLNYRVLQAAGVAIGLNLLVVTMSFGFTGLIERFTVNPFTKWCEGVYNVRWTGTPPSGNGNVVAFRSNCCSSATSGGVDSGYGGGCAPPPGTGQSCCPGAPLGYSYDGTFYQCGGTSCTYVSEAWPTLPPPVPPPNSGAYYLITKEDLEGTTRHVEVEFTLGDPLFAATGEHAGLYSSADNVPIPTGGIEAAVFRSGDSNAGPDEYELFMLVGGGGCTCDVPNMNCISSCNSEGCSCTAVNLATFDIVSLATPCKIEIDSAVIGTLPDDRDRISITARVSGGCLTGGPHVTSMTVVTDDNWYTFESRRIALAGARYEPRTIVYDNLIANGSN